MVNLIYLAIWYDRHSDDQYAAFHELADAIDWCKSAQNRYEGQYTWNDVWPDTDGWVATDHYPYYANTVESDDGPITHVERITLQ